MSEFEATPERIEALKRIVGDWIGEGFTTPPYPDAYYDIFEWLGLSGPEEDHWYDTRRPTSDRKANP